MVLRRKRNIDHVYSGTPMKVGPGWIPDFVEVSFDASEGSCDLTLIELEATEIAALASSRKYLPESSSSIIQAFATYLDSVLSQCRATADQRIEVFEKLRNFFTGHSAVTVRTAGALRTSSEFLEDLLLIDQPEHHVLIPRLTPETSEPFLFLGSRLLSRAEKEGLRRTIRIFDAVAMGRDNSGGTLKSWRNIPTKPIDKAVLADPNRYPVLKGVLFSKADTGLRITCEDVAKELTELWSGSDFFKVSQSQIAEAINKFYPIASSLRQHDQMRRVFDQARTVLEGKAI